MAVTENNYPGNGSETDYSITFEYLDEADIKVSLNGAATTAYTLANATTVSFNTAPANGVAIRIYRETSTESPKATFYPGSAIRAQDLNDNQSQVLYVAQEALAAVVNAQVGDIADGSIGTSKLAVGAVTNDRIQDDAVTSSKILNGTIVNEDINASAAIAQNKLNLSVTNAEVNAAAGIAYSKLNLANSILNADINSSAGIAHSKLANLTSGQVLIGSVTNVPTARTLSGAITVSNTGITSLGLGVVGAANLTSGVGIPNQVLSTNGSSLVWANVEQRSEVSSFTNIFTGYTTVEIAGVPAWAKEITINYTGLATSSNTPCSIQLGDSSTYYSTGSYFGKVRSHAVAPQDLNGAIGFRLAPTGAWVGNATNTGYYLFGSLSLRQGNDSWTAIGQGTVINTATSEMYFTTGSFGGNASPPVPLVLTRLRFNIDNGTSSFNQLSYRVIYRG